MEYRSASFMTKRSRTGLPSRGRTSGPFRPGHYALDLVPYDLLGLLQAIAHDRLTARPLNLDANASRSGCGVVEEQLITRKREETRHHFAPLVRCIHRGESVQPENVAADVPGGRSGVPGHVNRHLGITGGDDSPEGIVSPRHPIERPDARPDETLHEGAVVPGAATSAHEHRFRTVVPVAFRHAELAGLLVGEDLSPLEEARRHGDGNVGSPKIGERQVDVEVFLGNDATAFELHGSG